MNDTDGILGLLVLSQLEDLRRLALETAEPWRVPQRPARRAGRRSKAGAPECDLCYGDGQPGECACAS